MTVLPQLEAALLAAHARRSARPRRWRGRNRPTGGGVATLVAVGITIAVAAVAIVLVRHARSGSGGAAHHPPPVTSTPPSQPPPQLPANPTRDQSREEHYLFQAQAAVSTQCSRGLPNPRPAPTVSQGSPSAPLLSILGVLRRPAGPADKLPTRVVGRDRQVIPNGSLPPAKGIYVRYIRRARWRFGAGYYIVPAADVNESVPMRPGCAAAQRNALERELPKIPKRLHAGVLELESVFVAQMRYAAQPHAGICVLALNSTGGGDVGCGMTASDIESGNTTGSGGPTGVGVVYGVVPDGVATVTLYYRGRYPGHPETVHAIGNVWILPDPGQRLPDYGFPRKIIWRSENGTVIKTVKSS